MNKTVFTVLRHDEIVAIYAAYKDAAEHCRELNNKLMGKTCLVAEYPLRNAYVGYNGSDEPIIK